MSQRAFLNAFDALAHQAFAAAGLADTGRYTPPDGGPSIPVRVLVDRSTQQLGQFGTVNAPAVTVGYLTADVDPAAGGVLLVDGDTYRNVREIDNDGALSRWEVRRG